MKHNPFGILFAVTLTVCLCVALSSYSPSVKEQS
jgi:hypothetical protein